MASNGLVANASKTVFMVLNGSHNIQENITITVGEAEVPLSKDTKLLGMQVEDTLKWDKNTTEKQKSENKVSS